MRVLLYQSTTCAMSFRRQYVWPLNWHGSSDPLAKLSSVAFGTRFWSSGAANGTSFGPVGLEAQVTSVGEPNTTSGQPASVRSKSCTLVCRYVEPSALPSYVTMFIFTFGFAAWYACTAGRRVESAQTVIWADSSWVTGLNSVVALLSVLV